VVTAGAFCVVGAILIGVVACDESQPDMMPWASYRLGGVVVDSDSGDGISGVVVAFGIAQIDTTDESGSWRVSADWHPHCQGEYADPCAIILSLPAEYSGRDTVVVPEFIQVRGADGTYRGEYCALDMEIAVRGE
jgi:hypothetical protein